MACDANALLRLVTVDHGQDLVVVQQALAAGHGEGTYRESMGDDGKGADSNGRWLGDGW